MKKIKLTVIIFMISMLVLYACGKNEITSDNTLNTTVNEVNQSERVGDSDAESDHADAVKGGIRFTIIDRKMR